MKKLALLALIAILGGAFYLIRDVGHVPLFDAGLRRLAETAAEGYCAGSVFANDQPHPKEAADCRETTTKSTDIDLAVVQRATCEGYDEANDKGGSEWVGLCTEWMQAEQWWPTYDAQLTNNWSPSTPYPLERMLSTPNPDSRTGTRDGFSRDDPTTTTTTTSETTTTETDG